MLRTSETESEILLGNKQLLAIFFIVAVLLGIAFYGGYMVGRNAAPRGIPTTSPVPAETASTPAASTAGETHSITPDSSTGQDTSTSAAPPTNDEPPLGSPKRKTKTASTSTTPAPESTASSAIFTPQAGQMFLQVTAVGRDEAAAIADVLQKKGFRAHAAPKPGNPKLYRVLVGPIADAGDLSATRDSLRKTGFREVIVQRY